MLVVSFVALALGWSQPQLQAMHGRPLFGIPRAVEVVLGALGVAVFAVAVYAGLPARTRRADNLAPTAVYVGFWVGIPFLSLLFGDVFRLFSPWRAIGRADRLGRRRASARAAGAARRTRRGSAAGPAAAVALRVRDLRAVLGARHASPGRWRS